MTFTGRLRVRHDVFGSRSPGKGFLVGTGWLRWHGVTNAGGRDEGRCWATWWGRTNGAPGQGGVYAAEDKS